MLSFWIKFNCSVFQLIMILIHCHPNCVYVRFLCCFSPLPLFVYIQCNYIECEIVCEHLVRASNSTGNYNKCTKCRTTSWKSWLDKFTIELVGVACSWLDVFCVRKNQQHEKATMQKKKREKTTGGDGYRMNLIKWLVDTVEADNKIIKEGKQTRNRFEMQAKISILSLNFNSL